MNAALGVATLVAVDRLADYVTFRFPRELLAAARKAHGLARMDQIHYAILEKSGGITIVPREHAA